MSDYLENEHQNERNYEFRNSKVDDLVRDPGHLVRDPAYLVRGKTPRNTAINDR